MPSRVLPTRSAVQWTGLVAAPVLALVAYALLPDAYTNNEGQSVVFSHAGRVTAATALWMAVWWMSEAIPIYATSLLPLAVLPAAGAVSMKDAAAPYGHELIFLFMGGFILALSMQRWDLHKRIAFTALRLVGTQPHRMIGGFMLATAAMSMWVSNTATTVMMLPIALSVIDLVVGRTADHSVGGAEGVGGEEGHNFALCLLLGIAYAASIGGIATPIGTPPNLYLISYIKTHLDFEVSFTRWLGIGIPLVIVFLPIAWLLLTRVLYPFRTPEVEGGRALAKEGYRNLGPMKFGEWATFVVFLLTAVSWIFRPLLARIAVFGHNPLGNLTDSGIAMMAALALFAIPVDLKKRKFVMNWETAVKLPWGVLILFGGGLSLAAAIQAEGVGEWIGSLVTSFAGLPPVAVVVCVVAMVIFLTELTSNTATTATLVPILAAIAGGLGLQSILLIVPAAIAASCAFMLPVATPPNAIIFGSGHVRMGEMVRAGVWLNLIGIVLIAILTFAVVRPLLRGL